MNNIISIFINQRLNPVFARANADLISCNQKLFLNADHLAESYNKDMFQILENLWYEKYNARIKKSQYGWKQLEFDSEQDKALFSLKYSS